MAVKLHRCPVMWPKTSAHPCWKVQIALDEAGIEYEIVKEAWPLKGRRSAVIEHTGQNRVPAIEFADGTWYREESADMADRIQRGELGVSGKR